MQFKRFYTAAQLLHPLLKTVGPSNSASLSLPRPAPHDTGLLGQEGPPGLVKAASDPIQKGHGEMVLWIHSQRQACSGTQPITSSMRLLRCQELAKN